jgi:hypothetical protein
MFIFKQKSQAMKSINLVIVGLLVLGLGTFNACRKDKNQGNTATINMRLTDDPGNYDAVYLDIQQIAFKMEGRSELILYPKRPGVCNILNFRNGLDTILLNTTVPVGKIEQIRLVLGANNTVVANGVSYPMSTPSAQESGVKLNLHTNIEANVAYNVWIDFDAGKSIVKTGNGGYKLKPVIRAYSDVTNGKIVGAVLPIAALATVYAVNGTDTSAAIPSGVDGHFVISGLFEGNYHLIVEPGVAAYATFGTDVNVSYGAISNVGTITLLP